MPRFIFGGTSKESAIDFSLFFKFSMRQIFGLTLNRQQIQSFEARKNPFGSELFVYAYLTPQSGFSIGLVK